VLVRAGVVVDDSLPFEPEVFLEEFFSELETYEALVKRKPY
jgi:hypothetical protein